MSSFTKCHGGKPYFVLGEVIGGREYHFTELPTFTSLSDAIQHNCARPGCRSTDVVFEQQDLGCGISSKTHWVAFHKAGDEI